MEHPKRFPMLSRFAANAKAYSNPVQGVLLLSRTDRIAAARNLARRKHIAVVVRLKELQPGDSHAICAILTQCSDMQLDQVFGSLDEPERTEALRLLAQEIGKRYQESSGPISTR
jgi:hypothetical protein